MWVHSNLCTKQCCSFFDLMMIIRYSTRILTIIGPLLLEIINQCNYSRIEVSFEHIWLIFIDFHIYSSIHIHLWFHWSACLLCRVISEFTQAEEVLNNVDIRAVQTCLNNNKAVLAEHSSALPLCLLQQLTKSPDDMSGQMEDFLNQAKSPGFDCLLSSLG